MPFAGYFVVNTVEMVVSFLYGAPQKIRRLMPGKLSGWLTIVPTIK
jgi:hypothetical protein